MVMPSSQRPKAPDATMNSSWWTFIDFVRDPVVVLNKDHRLVHCNPLFEKIFGWTVEDMARRNFFSIFGDQDTKVIHRLQKMSATLAARGIKAHWITKDRQKLKVTIDAVTLLGSNQIPAGMVLILRGFSSRKKSDRSRQILLRMSKALHRYRRLDRLLRYVTRLIQALINVDGASVIFLDAEKEAFYFQMTSHVDTDAGRRFSSIRFPSNRGAAGEVYRTGKPLIVEDYVNSPYAFKIIDEQTQYETRNLLDVPLRIKDRMIGVLCAVNKREGAFDEEDVELLSAIADVVALPIENSRINEALQRSYNRLKVLNAAKERVVVHLSHELKTPLAVLSASLQLLKKKLRAIQDHSWRNAYDRAQRNLQRLLEMEYSVEDMLRQHESASFDLIRRLPQAKVQTSEPDNDTHFFHQVNIEFLIHELKGPLSMIEANSGMVDNMLRNDPAGSHRTMHFLGRISRGVSRMRTLLDELLEVGRAEAVSFNCQPFVPLKVARQVLFDEVEIHCIDLYDKLQSIKKDSRKLAFLASNGIHLEAQPAAEEIRIVQDETKFRQIVANLLKNALTYRRQLLLINLTTHKDALTLSVRDDGPGVAAEHTEKIFERYTQVSSYPGVARSGHGLGLAVSRILARAMDGDITLESQLGQGALFKLVLPLEFDAV